MRFEYETITYIVQYRDFFIDPNTGKFYKEGDLKTNPKFSATLKVIAEEGSDAFYSAQGSFTQKIVDEVNAEGGIFSIEDLTSYRPKWGSPVEAKLFNGETLYNFPLPATGSVINFIINILNGFDFQRNTVEFHNEDKLIFHKLMEAFKFGFAQRTKLGDESTGEVLETVTQLASKEYADTIRNQIRDDKTFNDFAHYGANSSVVVDHGTGHLSVLAPNGDAVALTSTINLV